LGISEKKTINLKRVNLLSTLAEFTFKKDQKNDVFNSFLKEISITFDD